MLFLQKIILSQKSGEAKGVFSICSANPTVLEASIKQAACEDTPLLIESTSNQVNQYGGYTGMNPKQFVKFVCSLAERQGLFRERLIIGGDHLGPNPWQNETTINAMAKAHQLIRDCVLAGYTKIHLDTSMKCSDDNPNTPLSKEVSAQRAAELCLTAEDTFRNFVSEHKLPVYVIGTEVPPPGGHKGYDDHILITTTEDAKKTLEETKTAFKKYGIEKAWERVIGLVVQPGVEFGDQNIIEYDHQKANQLSLFIETCDNLVYEAHSTDYQTQKSLTQMVKNHFAILKVGPELTFAFREAVFSLANIENELLAGKKSIKLSNIKTVVDDLMVKNPYYWSKYYCGNECDVSFARKYSLNDRIRYYWSNIDVQNTLKRLINNLNSNKIPLSLVSQFMPIQYKKIREGKLGNSPNEWIEHNIGLVLLKYAQACRN